MPAPGEEHSLCGSVSVLSCAPPRPASLSVCMYDCQYETPCGLVVCVPLPGTDESEQRGNSVVARRAGRPRSARLAPATRHLPQILRSSGSRRFHTCGTASAPTGAAAGARPGLSERCVYTTTRRLPRHAAHAPPRRTHSCPIAARAAWGPVGGETRPTPPT